MRHRFNRVEIPEGRTWEWETCIYCGVQRQRHRNGVCLFRQGDGTLKPKSDPCKWKQLSVDDRVTPGVPIVEERCATEEGASLSLIAAPVPTYAKGTVDSGGKVFVNFGSGGEILPLRELPKKYADADEAVRNRRFSPRVPTPASPPIRLTDVEARLKDAYVIIQVLYEDAVTAGLRSAGRQMAGRLLYSAGYQETIKHLEK